MKHRTPDPGAVLLLGLLLFVLEPGELAALLPAVFVHELGHLLALRSFGVPVYGMSLTLSGPVLRCGADSRRAAKVLGALGGPAAGLLLWAVLRGVWPLCAEVSLLLSLANLLPVLPLDGGRALSAMLPARFAGDLMQLLGFLVPVAIMAAGLYAVSKGYGASAVFFGVWLLLLACQGTENDVK